MNEHLNFPEQARKLLMDKIGRQEEMMATFEDWKDFKFVLVMKVVRQNVRELFKEAGAWMVELDSQGNEKMSYYKPRQSKIKELEPVYVFSKEHLSDPGWLPSHLCKLSEILSNKKSRACYLETILPRLTFEATNSLEYHKRRGNIQHLSCKNQDSHFIITSTAPNQQRKNQEYLIFNKNE